MALLPVRTRRRLAAISATAVFSSAVVLSTSNAFAQAGEPAKPAEASPASQTAPVKIGTSDGKGLIYLDDKLVGEGSFTADVPAGTHKLKITREGYDTFEEDLVVKGKEPLARTVTLKLSSIITTGQAIESERLEGLYGGFGLAWLLTPGGTNSSIQTQCENRTNPTEGIPTLASCDAPGGMGGGLGGFVGYSWNPIGIELYVAGHFDQRTLTNTWNPASTDLGIGPDPGRREEFALRRAGGMGLARVRVSYNTKRLRLDFATGAGIAYRVMFLERNTTALDDASQKDVFVSNTPSYVSPVIAFEPSVALRLTPGVAVSLGFQLFLESPGTFMNGDENPTTERERRVHALGQRTLTTPPYELAKDLQVFMGPVLGMTFGP